MFAMFFSHWTLEVSCFLGSLIGTLTAQIFKFPEHEIRQGLYGFNSSLAMMCTLFTFGLVDASDPLIWLLGITAAVVSTFIMRWFLKHGKVAFTFPFVLTCWIFCWAVAHFHLFGLSQTTPPLPDTNTLDTLASPFLAWAEVNFGNSLATGILIFIAVAISSPTAAFTGLAVAPIAALIAHFIWHIDTQSLSHGLYSYSAILIACAFSGSHLRHAIYTLIGVILAVNIQYAVAQTGLATYTIGFVLTSWLILWFKRHLPSHFFINRQNNCS